MYQDNYFVPRNSGTYAETLEAFGLAYFLREIFSRNERYSQIQIQNFGIYYELGLDDPVTKEMIDRLSYFPLFNYIAVKNESTDFVNAIDYEREKAIKKAWDQLEDKKEADEELRPHPDYDVFSNIYQLSALSGYKKAFLNFADNRRHFRKLIQFILKLYSEPEDLEGRIKKELAQFEKAEGVSFGAVNALQILNPNQGKGVNRPKSNSIALSNMSAFWLRQAIRFAGCWRAMSIRPVKAGSTSWDTKIYVMEPHNMDFEQISSVYRNFKPKVKGAYAVGVDISCIGRCLIELIKRSEHYEGGDVFWSPQDKIAGFHSVYLKDLGQSKAVTNIGFLALPNFVGIRSKDDGDKWIAILEDHLAIVGALPEEHSSTYSMLQAYRQFLSSGDWDLFFAFNFEYAAYLVQQIAKEKYYIKPFNLKLMEELLMSNDKFIPIIESTGFKNIARAIRNSTIREQYAKAHNRQNFDIRYGMAQDLKRKSEYNDQLVQYISEFVALYNAETARYAERNPELLKAGKIRPTIKTNDVEAFVRLVDQYGAPIVGKLLAAYGYALERRDASETGDGENSDEQLKK